MTRTIVHLSRGREWRGGERQVLLLVRTLATHHPLPQHLITGHDTPLARAALQAGLAVHPLRWTQAWDPRILLGLSRQLTLLRQPGDQLLLHAHDSHALAFALAIGRLRHLPLVATRRSILPAGPLWRRADRVVAVSHAVAVQLQQDRVAAGRIHVVPSAVHDDALSPPVPPPPVRPDPRLVAVGALTAEKGHATLLDAFAALDLPGARLLIAGSGPEEAGLRQRAIRLGIEARVTFDTRLEDPVAAISGADLFVQPSLREALGTAVLAAMAGGIPVVASHTGGLIELLADGAGLTTPAGNVEALTGMLRCGLHDGPLREALVATAHARVRHFGARRMADQMVDVYGSVLCDP